MPNIFKKIDDSLSHRLLYAQDLRKDKKICGQSLCKYVPSVFRDDKNGVGMTGSHSTHYIILKRIFSHVQITQADSFVDVGCGKGRVLAFLLQQKAPCRISGIEINEVSGAVAEEWTKQYEQVQVILADAFTLNYNDYSILFFGRPFLPKTFLAFIEMLEKNLTHPITLVYWVDQQSGHLLHNRDGWTLRKREILSRIHGLKIEHVPQSYSIWSYTPPSETAIPD